MDGYERHPDVTEELVAAVRAALYAHPAQRLGQIIVNASRGTDDVAADLFYVWDETLARRLRAYAEVEA